MRLLRAYGLAALGQQTAPTIPYGPLGARCISYAEKQRRLAPKKPRGAAAGRQAVRPRLATAPSDNSPLNMPIPEALRYLRAAEVCRNKTTYRVSFQLESRAARGTAIQGQVELPSPVRAPGVTICVIAAGAQAEEARRAGAAIVGTTAVIEDIVAGNVRFSQCICHKDHQALLRPVQRILGPLGLMPVEKRGTITDDVASAVRESLSRTPYRMDEEGVLELSVGNAQHSAEQVEANIMTVVKAIEDQVLRQSQDIVVHGAHVSSTHGFDIPLRDVFRRIG